jgi:uncharacterized protein (TIGR03437 family)
MSIRLFALICLVAAFFGASACWAQSYTINTVAGGGNGGGADGLGDGGPAVMALLRGNDAGVAVDNSGNLYIADTGANLIRKVAPNGTISVAAGDVNGNGGGYYGDGGPAVGAGLNNPFGVAVDAAGNLYIADFGNGRVRKVSTNGTISTVAGGGSNLFLSGPATQAFLPSAVATVVDSAGNIFIGINLGGGASAQVLKVSADGMLRPYAGNPNTSLSLGDGGPATSAVLTNMTGGSLAVDTGGNLYIADPGNNRIRKVSTGGIITTVAGSNSSNYSGDGGTATSAGLNVPAGVTVDSNGNLYISDSGNYRVRKVTPDGTITTIAGNGHPGFSGDGGPAANAEFFMLGGLAAGKSGGVYVADMGNARVRLLTPTAPPAGSPPSIQSGGVVSAGAFGQFTSVAPASWIEIYGSNLATDSRGWAGADFSGVNAPTSLDGTKVTIGGQAAFVDYISPGQVNAQVPSTVGTGPQPLVVTTAAGASSAYTITVNAQEPGLLAPSSFTIGGKQYAGALFSDGATYVLPPGAIAGVNSRRAQPGDGITLYGVGFGAVAPNIPAGQIVQQTNALALPFHLFFGPTEATVSYAGLAPSAVGLYQFNVTVPNISNSDTVPLTFTLGGVSGAQTLFLAVQNGNAPSAPQVQSLALSASQAPGGGSVQGTVILSAPAPSGGAVVLLSSSSTAAAVPATITVPANSTSATFTVSTGVVTSNQTATITATYGGSSMQTSLTVTAAATASLKSLQASVTFQPAGSASFQTIITITPNAGNVSYSASLPGGASFINGTATNQGQTFTFSAVQPNGSFLVPPASIFLVVASGSLNVTLTPTASSAAFAQGNISGTLSLTGSPLGGGTALTLSGPITGSYSETLQP